MSALAYVRWFFPFSAAPSGSGDGGRDGRKTRLSLVRDESAVKPESDAALVARLRTGDEGALLEVIRADTVVLTRYARVLTGSNETAADVVQDVFVSVWEQREGLQPRGPLRQYLLGAVRHRALNILRGERSRTRTAAAAVQGDELISVTKNDALDRLAAEDINAVVARALGSVAPQCRTIFLLNWQAGLSYAEIAQQLGISIRTVYNQMYRATKMLASLLRERPRE
jgi:RNA polymerase sigma-70 factor, ECF subfamily